VKDDLVLLNVKFS